MNMTGLRNALQGCILTDTEADRLDITGLQIDSRLIKEGDAFVAISGYVVDGHDYIEEAVSRGAGIVIGEKPLSLQVPYIQVEDSRNSLAKLAAAFYNYPSENHKIIGITGTNGKTTCSYMIRHILKTACKTCSLIGTISYIINEVELSPENTTPNSLKLQEMLAESRDEFIVMEISSHALDQSRIEGLQLDLGLFTNLSHDHLDYHHTMEEYFQVKSKMFSYLKVRGRAVINTLDPYGQRLALQLETGDAAVKILGRRGSDLSLGRIDGRRFTFFMGGAEYSVHLNMPGIHNVYNAALSILACVEAGISVDLAVSAMASFSGVPGRFEIFRQPSGGIFVIDYAHTEDAIEACLKTIQEMGAKRIIHILGFRGGRDISKRKRMLEASAGYSSRILLTGDDRNGLSADQEIEGLIEAAESAGITAEIIADRTLAIEEAWGQVEEGDVVLLSGKGPERYKEKYWLPAESDRGVLEYLLTGCRAGIKAES
ncbi:UDP-N-acetylmuramoyl-L-alanyl-D-glutamate--2,6-diaminopimelate ligase [Peribacillus sp. SCS-37]|uniref:UDP-N-acetylmuramoyl-L-alanyl-D-glutamate--2, 6-diaminopimelate ligase n=1 Tax=Paraperibacillus esterisolvens TaxID=3115296 RepID=UPI003906C1EC